jgi:hypothetical protein
LTTKFVLPNRTELIFSCQSVGVLPHLLQIKPTLEGVRMLKTLATLLLVLIAFSAVANDTTISTNFDLRVRQEFLDGVYHFAPDTDRNWLRTRSRFGVTVENGEHQFSARLCNEFRNQLDTDSTFNEDELIIDQLFYKWENKKTTLTIGRQDIIWPGGFLMLEGHPLDGSRSIYHNAVRIQQGGLDIALINNPMYDDFVLLNDQNRRLTDMDEIGFATRFTHKNHQFSLIWKDEDDMSEEVEELSTASIGYRYKTKKFLFEATSQFQDDNTEQFWEFAGHMNYKVKLNKKNRAEFGGFHYSEGYRSPWGKWPMWSELYIYTLIGEGNDGRAHVAEWSNITAPYATLKHKLNKKCTARLTAYQLFTDKPSLQVRGTLTQAELKYKIGKGTTSHLLWECLIPGEFHDGSIDSPIHFVRWQFSHAI